MSDDEDRILAEAQERLEQRRSELRHQRAAEAPQRFTPPREMKGAPAGPRLLKRLGLQRTASLEKAFSMGKPGLLYVMPPDAAGEPPADVDRRIQETIPDAFLGVTWEILAGLRNSEGEPSLGALEVAGGGRLRGAAAVHEARRRIEHARKVVIFGPTRAGKTLLAVAALEAELRRGNDRARWVHAPTLRDPDVMAKALSSSFLVLDDLGYELDGAPEGSGWISQKRGPACDFLGRWYLRRDARLIVTTFMGLSQMTGAYGEGAAMRVYEGASVIMLHKE